MRKWHGMGASKESYEKPATVEVEIVYESSGRVVKFLGPATAKLLDWVREIDAAEDVIVIVRPVSDPSR